MSNETSWVAAMPDIYERCLGPVLFAPYAEHLGQIAAALAPARVLEIAAGSGIATSELVRLLPHSAITATDLNPAMVYYARERIAGPSWQQADAQALAFDDNCFDLVLCQFGAMFFPDKQRAFAEAARVMAPGGTFLFTVWDVVAASTFTAALVDSLAAVLPEDAPTFIARVPHGYSDQATVQADVNAAGLRLDSFERVVLPSQAPSAQSLAQGFCLGTPLRFELEERGDLTQLTDAITAEMAVRLGDGPLAGELAALVISAQQAPQA